MGAHRVRRRLTLARSHRLAPRVFIGSVFVALLALGAFVAYLLPSGSAAAAGSSSEGSSSTATTADTSSTGSDKLLAWLLVGLFALLFVPFIIDVWRTHSRKKELLDAVKPTIGKLSEAERDDLAKQTTTGIEGLSRTLMAFGVIGVFAVVLLYVVIKNVNIASDSVVGNAMAALITLLTAVVAFYFGTRTAQTSAAAAASAAHKATAEPPAAPQAPVTPAPPQPSKTETTTETEDEKQARIAAEKREELQRLAKDKPVTLKGQAPMQEQEATQEQETPPTSEEPKTPPTQ